MMHSNSKTVTVALVGGRSVIGALGIGLSIVACNYRPQAERTRQIELTEVWSDALPDSFEVSGVAGNSRNLVVWSRSQPFLLLRDSIGQYSEYKLGSARLPAAAALSTETGNVTFVYSADSTKDVNVQGMEMRVPSNLIQGLDDAQFIGKAWYLGVSDSGSSLTLASFTVYELRSGHLRPLWSFSVPKTKERPFAARAAVDAGSDSTLIVSQRYAPHAVWILDRNGNLVRTLQTPRDDGSVDMPLGSVWEHGELLRTLSLEPGYLQTLASPNGIGRILATYDSAGALMNVQQLDQPIGFVTSSSEDHVVLAFRRFDRQELVAYKWRWVAADPSCSRRCEP